MIERFCASTIFNSNFHFIVGISAAPLISLWLCLCLCVHNAHAKYIKVAGINTIIYASIWYMHVVLFPCETTNYIVFEFSQCNILQAHAAAARLLDAHLVAALRVYLSSAAWSCNYMKFLLWLIGTLADSLRHNTVSAGFRNYSKCQKLNPSRNQFSITIISCDMKHLDIHFISTRKWWGTEITQKAKERSIKKNALPAYNSHFFLEWSSYSIVI